MPWYEPEASHAPDKQQDPEMVEPHTAKMLLLAGGMPPGCREWNGVAPITLPISGPSMQWPPQGWQQIDREERLLRWESVAVSLAMEFNLPLSLGSAVLWSTPSTTRLAKIY